MPKYDVPVEVLLPLIEEGLERMEEATSPLNGQPYSKLQNLVFRSGVDERRFYDMFQGKQENVSFALADKIVCALPKGPWLWFDELSAYYPPADWQEPKMERTLAPKEFCKYGHKMSGANLRISKTGKRSCHTCELRRSRAKNQRIKERRLKNAA